MYFWGDTIHFIVAEEFKTENLGVPEASRR